MTSILLDILAPILLMIALGAWLRRKFAVDIGTLNKLNLYLFAPAFVFYYVSTSHLDWGKMGGIVTICVLQMILLAVIVWWITRPMKMESVMKAALLVAVIFYNSGNLGIPLAQFAYGAPGAAAQTFVMTTQGLFIYTVGMGIVAYAGAGSFGRGMLSVFRLPILPVMAAALFTRWWTGGAVDALPPVLRLTARYLADAMVPVALITLGAQLATNLRWPRWRPISLVMVLRLLIAPALTAAMLYGLHCLAIPALDLWPFPAALLILTSGTPTAVNTLLLTLELGGDAELAADCVFWTTAASCLTITLNLILLRAWLPV
jgi:predicted permease